jgi:presequence protease
MYDKSPTAGLKFEKPLAELKAAVAESGSKIFTDMEEEQILEEQSRLANIQSNMSSEEIAEIVRVSNKLKSLQAAEDSIEDRATIPSLQLSDLKREATEYPIAVTENEDNSAVTVVRHELGSTSGIA